MPPWLWSWHVGVFLVPDWWAILARFGIDQLSGQVELDHRVQLIQQRALHHRAGGPGVFRLKPVGDLLFQGGRSRLVFLGHLVVDLGRFRFFTAFTVQAKTARLARQMLGPVGFGEGHV